MANKKIKWIIPVIALVFGMVAVCVYAAVWDFTTKDAVTPDAQSAVVYFVGGSFTNASIWDGDRPVGNFDEKKVPKSRAIIPYKATPGEHYFMFNATNWIVMRADLEAGKRYMVDINTIKAAFMTFLIVNPQAADQEDKLLNHKNSKFLVFSDDWRADFAKGKIFKEAQDTLRDARNENKEVTLTSSWAF